MDLHRPLFWKPNQQSPIQQMASHGKSCINQSTRGDKRGGSVHFINVSIAGFEAERVIQLAATMNTKRQSCIFAAGFSTNTEIISDRLANRCPCVINRWLRRQSI